MEAVSTILGGMGTRTESRRGIVSVLWPEPKFRFPESEGTTGAVTDQVSAGAESKRGDVQQDFSLLDAIVAYPPRDVSLQLLDMLVEQDVPLATALRRRDVGFEILSSFYTVKDSIQIKQFLSRHQGLKKLLFAAFPKIKEMWGSEAKTELQLLSDPEDDSVSLVAYITSPRHDAHQLLDRFDEEWWLSVAASSDGLLTFLVQ